MSAAQVATALDTPVRRLIVGTAGHIDHGKTLLVKALTGTDCDRWAEEKARGITIDLGFASLATDEYQIGFIDVPGHHRFVPNALAGMGGVRVALLVVAATEGVMPQTREHIAICGLLGIPSLVVVLTKVDLVAPDLLELAELDVTELLEGTRFAGSPILHVSSVTGQGLDELRAELARQADRHGIAADRDAPVRLPVDRAFSLRGVGVVVTGTLASGVVAVGDELELLPGPHPVRVRGIQVHGQLRAEAVAGERTSLQLAGVKVGEVERGHQLTSPGGLDVSRIACARFTLLESAPAALQRPCDAQVFVYSTQVHARIRPLDRKILEPGETGLVELRFREPLPAVRGDRFILRRPTPATTLGGGEILDPAWSRRRGVPLQDDLIRLTGGRDDLFALWSLRSGYRAMALADFSARCGITAREAEAVLVRLADAGHVRRVVSLSGQERRWVSEDALGALKRRAVEVLEALFRCDRLARGMARAEFARRVLPRSAGPFVQQCLAWLEEERCISVDGELISLPGRTVQPTDAEARLVAIIEERFRAGGLGPPAVDHLKGQLAGEGHDAVKVRDALRYLVGARRLIRLPSQDLVSAPVLEELRTRLRQPEWHTFSVAAFKEAFGLTRRWAIPILEYCDATGITRREDSNRVVVDAVTNREI